MHSISESKFRPSYTFQSKGLPVGFVAEFLESTTKEHLKNGSISAHKLCKNCEIVRVSGADYAEGLVGYKTQGPNLHCDGPRKGLPSRANRQILFAGLFSARTFTFGQLSSETLTKRSSALAAEMPSNMKGESNRKPMLPQISAF